MIEDSDIGPENSILTTCNLLDFATESSLIFFSRKTNIFLIAYSIAYFLIPGSEKNSVSGYYTLYFFLFSGLVFFLTRFYQFYKIRELEELLDLNKIRKLKKVGKEKWAWKELSRGRIKIGDVVLVRGNSISPADILLLDTSDQRHSEKIAHANQRRIFGCRGIEVKTSIKNLNPNTKKNARPPTGDSLSKIVSLVNGEITYDSPIASNNFDTFCGNFKFSNDPKVLRVTSNNLLACGSRLYSPWVIGFVIYNGKNTKMFHRNFCLNEPKKFRRRKGKIELYTDQVCCLYLAICLIELMMCGLGMMTTTKDSFLLMMKFNVNDDSLFFFKTVLNIIGGLVCYMPFSVNIAIDFLDLVNTYFVNKEYTDEVRRGKESSDGIGFNLKKLKTMMTVVDDAPKLTRKKSFLPSIEEQSVSATPSPIKKLERTFSPNQSRFEKSVSSSNKGRIRKKRKKLRFLERCKVNIVNPRILSELGVIDHVIFDKTDTLTRSTVEIVRTVTKSKMYSVKVDQIMPKFKEVKKDPSKFQRVEELEEVMKLKEDDNYSEKSQEFLKEVKGDYQSEIFGENFDLQDDMKVIKNPVYKTKESQSSVPKQETKEYASPSIGQKTFGAMFGRKQFSSTKSILVNNKKPKKRIGGMIVGNKKGLAEMAVIMNDLNKKEKLYKDKMKVLMEQAENPRKKSFAFGSRLNLDDLGGKKSKKVAIRKEFINPYSSESSSEMILGSMEDEKDGIEVNPSKLQELEDMLCDYFFKNEDLVELVSCLMVCHEASTSSGGRVKTFRGEEKALIDFCRKLGISFSISSSKVKSSTDFYRKFLVKRDGKMESQLNIAGINSYSEGRKRMSVVVNDPSNGKNSFTLYVRGEEEGMKNVMKLSSKEKNTFKRLMVNFRSHGFKAMIFAKKELNHQTARNFMKTFQVIRKSRKGQSENFEKLANEIERGLKFVGALGYKDNVMPGAVGLLKKLKQGDINVSLLTGDKLENTINIVNFLGIVDLNFQDSSKYFNLKFSNENEGFLQFNRIMQSIYEKMRESSVNSIEVEQLIKSSKQGYKGKKTLMKARSDLFEHNDIHSDENVDIFKPLIVSGRAMNVILGDESLIEHFMFTLIFAKQVIGYSLSPFHKSKITQMLRKVKNEKVLAVGDGFNDIGMLKEADVGIQLYHREVPLIFGDVVVSDITAVEDLLFHTGRGTYKNYLVILFYHFGVSSFLNTMHYFYLDRSLFNGSLFQGAEANILNLFTLFMSIVYGVYEKTYERPVSLKFPACYNEVNYFSMSFISILIVVEILSFLIVFFEIVAIEALFVQSSNSRGFGLTEESISKVIYFATAVISSTRIIAIGSKSTGKTFWIGAIFITISLIWYMIYHSLDKNGIKQIPIFDLFSRYSSLFVATQLFIFFPMIEYLMNTLNLKTFMIYPARFMILQRYLMKDRTFLLKTGNDELKKIFNRKKVFNIIEKVRICYKSKMAFLDQQVKQILSLDSSHFSLGIHPLTCQIIDKNDRRRFDIFINKKQRDEGMSYKLISLTTGNLLIMFFVLNISNPERSNHYYFETVIPFAITLTLIPLGALRSKKFFKNSKLYLKAVIFLVILLGAFLTMRSSTRNFGFFVVSRLLSGPLILNFGFNMVALGLIMVLDISS